MCLAGVYTRLPIAWGQSVVVLKVPAHIGDFTVLLGHATPLLAPPAAAPLLAGQSLLGTLEPGFGLAQRPGISDRLARIGHEKVGQPKINAHALACLRQRLGGDLAGEDHVPVAARPLQRDRLAGALYRPMQPDFDSTDTRQVQPAVLQPPARLRVREAIVAVPALEPWVAPCLSPALQRRKKP